MSNSPELHSPASTLNWSTALLEVFGSCLLEVILSRANSGVILTVPIEHPVTYISF